MSTSRRTSVPMGDKSAELSAAAPTTPVGAKPATSTAAAIAAVAKFHRLVQNTAPAPTTTPEEDAQALIKSFRRKKNLRARLLLPLQGDDAGPSPSPPSRAHRRIITPRAKPHSPQKTPLSVEKQSVLSRLPGDEPKTQDDAVVPSNNREEEEGGLRNDREIEALARVHALLGSADEIDRWIATYETERAQFASFALFTEMKLDEIRDRYVLRAGRPNAVEAAACCATLLKMPGIVGCYKTLLDKLARGVLSVVYVSDHPNDDVVGKEADAPMAALVRACFTQKTYFQRAHELEMQVRAARSLTDPRVLRALTVEEIQTMVLQIPVRTMCEGVVNAYATHLPHLDFLLARIDDKKIQLQLEFYRLHGHRRRRLQKRSSSMNADGNDDDDDDDDIDDPNYPLAVPLSSSAQICRAITQHAATFSSSGKEMILCSILEHIEVDSFKDVFKRFDAHGKTCFLHHLSVLESTEHLQLILEQLPNPGDTLFRFYYVICGGGGSGRLEESGRPDPKNAFFQKVLSAEMEFFFLCDLAAYLNDDQWTLLSQEYEKNAQARKARRRRQRRRLADGDAGGDDYGEADSDEDGEDDELDALVNSPVRSSGSLEQFQTMVWNYIRQHKTTSPQIWSLMQAVLMSSLEETETVACLDHCIDRMQIAARWRKLLTLVEELGAAPGSGTGDTDDEQIRETRLTMLRKLFDMLSREDRTLWIDKMAAKHGTPKPQPPPARKEQAPPVAAMQPQSKPVSMDDPKPHIALMRLDTKMLWLEALLNAVANDKETSARTAMLKQTLLPFLNGQTPAVAPAQPAAPPKEKVLTLDEAEKTISEIVLQLKQKNPADEAALWQKIVPEHLRAKVKATSERSVSPMPQLVEKVPPPQPIEPVKPEPSAWWETSGPDSELAKAFRALLETKSEAEVLELLRRGEVPNADGDEGDAKTAELHKQGSAVLRNSVKRKVSAVVAVSQPMEWQEYVKVGMLDQGTQTDLTMASSLDAPAEKPAVVIRAPLTLTSLLGRGANDKTSTGSTPRRKGDGKFQKLNNTAVPRSISGLITSWRVNTDQLAQFAKKSMPTVLRLIADAYGELLTAGKRKANFQATVAGSTGPRGGVKELTLAQIVYQQFLHSYGLPGIADMHLLALSCALEAYRPQHLRVEFFSRFVFEEGSKLELNNYLEFLECLVCDDPGASSTTGNSNTAANSNSTNNNSNAGPVSTKRQRFVPRIVVSDKENWLVPLEKAQEAAQLCFRAMRKQAVTAFCDKLAVIAAHGTGSYIPGGTAGSATSATSSALTPSMALGDSGRSSPTVVTTVTPTPSTSSNTTGSDPLMLNMDFLLKLVVDEWRDEQLRREVHLLNVFRAGDVNGDGELTSAEFSQIVLAIDHTRDLGDVLLMYSETLRRTQCDAIDADTFLQIAKEYELDRAAWNEDGDLRNVVNDMNELQETWVHTRPFFIGTLEALVRDLPTVHFLRVCEGAGCGCLKCILDGYIGFQRMRREFFTTSNPRIAMVPGGNHRSSAVSEALLWARFWHLMRQLYEAASESPGILTAWEGADYMRVHAMPRPPPRFLKYRRMALPNFLFPDTTRISGKVSKPYEQAPEVFDRDGILNQFAKLMELMSYTTGGKGATSAISDGANPQ